jgi:hypothetical protein
MEVDAGADFDLALLTAAAAGRGPVGRRRSPGGPITLRRERDDAGWRRPGRARGEHEEAVPEAGRGEAERLGVRLGPALHGSSPSSCSIPASQAHRPRILAGKRKG